MIATTSAQFSFWPDGDSAECPVQLWLCAEFSGDPDAGFEVVRAHLIGSRITLDYDPLPDSEPVQNHNADKTAWFRLWLEQFDDAYENIACGPFNLVRENRAIYAKSLELAPTDYFATLGELLATQYERDAEARAEVEYA